MDVKKILLPTDFSECSNAALDHALFLAEHFDAGLDLLHVVVLHEMDPYGARGGFPDTEDLYHRLQELASGEMRDLLGGRTTGRIEIREAQRRGVAAAPAIVDYAAEEDVDLIVMGAHGRRGFRRFLLGSVAEEVVRLAPCPVLTLRGGEAAPLHQIREVLVPFDFSKHSRTALAAAARMATSYGARLHLLHVVEPIMEPHPYVPVHYRPESFDLPQLMSRVEEDLGSIAAELVGGAVPCEIKVLEGHPAWCIAEHAEKIGADLIAMATHGRTGLSRFFLGSVTEKVVRSAHCPVLTLKVEVED
jgi:nucleotide-binding universal stress UspA family protein